MLTNEVKLKVSIYLKAGEWERDNRRGVKLYLAPSALWSLTKLEIAAY